MNNNKKMGLSRSRVLGVAALLGATALVSPALAQQAYDYSYWQGAPSGYWVDDSNWDENSAPDDSNDVAIFETDANVDLDNGGNPIQLNGIEVDGTQVFLSNGLLNFIGDDPGVLVENGIERGLLSVGDIRVGDGTGEFWKGGDGVLDLTGELSGSVHVEDGTLNLGYSGTDLIPTLAVADEVDAAADVGYGTTGSVTGRVTLDEGTTLALGDPDLSMGSGYGPTSYVIGSLAGSGTVDVNGALGLDVGSDNTDFTFSGAIGNDGAPDPVAPSFTLRKTGTGTFTITDDANIAIGTLQVDGGKVLFNATPQTSLITPTWRGVNVVVNNTGTLGGNGVIGSLVVNNGGTVSPGNSIDTLVVNGPATFNDGSTFVVEVTNQSADMLLASGAVTINGGDVVVDAERGRYAPETDYVILASLDEGVTGEFDGVTSNLAYLAPSLIYTDDEVILHLERLFRDVAQTPNEAAVEDQVLDGTNPLFDAIIGLSEDDARDALDNFSGEIHASAQALFVEDSAILRDAALNRAGTEGSAPQSGEMVDPVTGQGLGLWGVIFAKSTELPDDGNAAQLDATSGGIIAGLDGVAGDWRLGALLSYGQTFASVGDARDSSLDSDDYGFGVYAGTNWNDTKLKLGAAFANHFIDTERNVAVGPLSETITADYNATTAQVFAELSHQFALGNGTALEPFAQLAVVGHSTEGFDEEGGASALGVDSSTFRAALGTIGVRGSAEFALDGAMQVKLTGALGYRHAFADAPEVENQFALGDSFTIAGAPLVENALVVEAGVDFDVNSNTNLNLSYKGQFGDDTAAHAAKATFSYSF